jgi:hypothetical protein
MLRRVVAVSTQILTFHGYNKGKGPDSIRKWRLFDGYAQKSKLGRTGFLPLPPKKSPRLAQDPALSVSPLKNAGVERATKSR